VDAHRRRGVAVRDAGAGPQYRGGLCGLLDLGFIAFFAVGAYLYSLLASSHLADNFPAIAAMFPNGLHISFWIVIFLAALLAGLTGLLLGYPVLRLRGDYLAIVTLGFGEIVRIFMLNLDRPINITNGPKGISGWTQSLCLDTTCPSA
jgi:branched-chain amino acid transport system permease protein